MKIYYGDIRGLDHEEIFERQMQLVPKERRLKVMAYRFQEDRLRSLCAGLLLEYGLRECGLTLLTAARGRQMVQLELSEHGKPYICGQSGIYFNLSHSGDYAAAVFADCRAGIDIEQVNKHRSGIAERCFTQEEQEDLRKWIQNKKEMNPPGMSDAAPADFRFTELWTRKESFIKAEGSGLSLPLNEISVLGDLSFHGNAYYFRSFKGIPGYFMSVCGQQPIKDAVPKEIYPENIL